MNTFTIDICVTVACIALALILKKNKPNDIKSRPQAYILENHVTHARLLPVESSLAFTYPTVAMLLSLDALERNQLDLGMGCIFGYGGLWGRIVGLRPNPYLTPQPGTIRHKLETILRERGFIDEENGLLDAWMMTMPSFLGFEGINPLTVYFCYNLEGEFWLLVLEIHNTFGESHVHVLEIGVNEEIPSNGYDHQWTFPREFHVSPFNDRSGFYTISAKTPSHSPMATPVETYSPPKPSVRVHLFNNSLESPKSKGLLKLTALLRPIRATPLSTSALLLALAKAPFSLLLTMPRILFMAWKLHYQKRLDVFLRPEPLPGVKDWTGRMASGALDFVNNVPGGVKWLGEGLIDRFARGRVELFLQRRVRDTGIQVRLVAADPSIRERIFSPPVPVSAHLTISYLSSRCFTILFLSPSAQHALLLGADTEKIFTVSSPDLFLSIFSAPASSKFHPSFLQCARCQALPPSMALEIPPFHFMDTNGVIDRFVSGCMIFLHRILDSVERWVFSVTHARVVQGQEPWMQWERAAAVLDGNSKQTTERSVLGSVRRKS